MSIDGQGTDTIVVIHPMSLFFFPVPDHYEIRDTYRSRNLVTNLSYYPVHGTCLTEPGLIVGISTQREKKTT